MADIEANRVDCVVVYKVDRLSRSLMDFSRLMETFDKQRVSFVSVTQQFNTTHSMGRLTLNILLSFAQFERELVSERTRDKIAAARRKGKWSGGHPLLGYDILKSPGGSKIVVNAAEAERVRAIYALYEQGRGLIATSQELNQRGWTTKAWTTWKGKPRGGRPFDKNSLFKLLRNAVYMGKIRHHTELFDGEHERIVEPEVFERVQRLLQRNGRTGGMHMRNLYGALLKGILFCRPCARLMSHHYSVSKNRVNRYYVCRVAQTKGWDECPTKSIPATAIEEFVVARIRELAVDPDVLAATLARTTNDATERRAELEDQRAVLTRELASAAAGVRTTANAAHSNGHAADRLADLQDRVRRAQSEIAEIDCELTKIDAQTANKAEIDAALQSFGALWETLAPREQARVIHLFIERIEYDPTGKVSIAFHDLGLTAAPGANCAS